MLFEKMGSLAKTGGDNVFDRLKTFIQQHPRDVAALFQRHDIQASPYDYRTIGNAVKAVPGFWESLINAFAKSGAVSNFTGDDRKRDQTLNQLANGAIVFSNILRETQRRPVPNALYQPQLNLPGGYYPQYPYWPEADYDYQYGEPSFVERHKDALLVVLLVTVLFLILHYSKK